LIIVDDSLKAVPMPIKVILISHRVKVSDSAGWVAQKCVRKLIESSDLGFITQATNLRMNFSNQFRLKLYFFVEMPTYIYNYSFTIVMIVWHRMEMMLTGILGILVNSIILMSIDFLKRPDK